jgi:polysaccharide pyruvyl transferase WcaK-like protein
VTGRILVVGGYGYGNVGDEAMLAGLLTKLDGRQVTVVSRDPRLTTRLHGVAAVPIGAAMAALRTHRTVLIGGGSLFGRDMGRIGRLLPAFGIGARLLGRRVVLDGIGLDDVGPSARAVRRLLSVASEVTVRDARSLELAEGWGIDARQAPDLSTRMPAVGDEVGRELLRASGVDLRRPVVGLCLTGVDAQLGDRVQRAVASAMHRLPQVEFVFIPMARHPTVPSHDDLVLGRQLQQLQPRLHLLQTDGHPAHVLSVFRSLQAAVCMRFHSLLFAERAGTAIVPIAYASKCSSWLAERNMASVEPDGTALHAALLSLLPAQRLAG